MNNKYKNVVIPVDLEHPSSWYNALPMAVEFARNNEATLHVITVAAQADIPAVAIHLPKDIDDQIISATAERLKRLVQQEVPSDIETLTAVGQGRIYKEVLRLAAKADADLIVMASHRPEITDFLIGANAANVMRHAPCSVMVVREQDRRAA
ncbi:universal stress protein [Pontibacterium sp.]|uniref:universal stress protein n=1 Tax=Pontibacterium sp. TaxID=2036026 RepID=UPI003519D3DC